MRHRWLMAAPALFGNDPLHNTDTDAKFVERWSATIINKIASNLDG